MKMLHSLLLFLALILISPVGHARFAEPVQSPQQASFVVTGSAAPTLAKVREIIGLMDITAVPQTPPYVQGFAQARLGLCPHASLLKH